MYRLLVFSLQFLHEFCYRRPLEIIILSSKFIMNNLSKATWRHNYYFLQLCSKYYIPRYCILGYIQRHLTYFQKIDEKYGFFHFFKWKFVANLLSMSLRNNHCNKGQDYTKYETLNHIISRESTGFLPLTVLRYFCINDMRYKTFTS